MKAKKLERLVRESAEQDRAHRHTCWQCDGTVLTDYEGER